MALQVTPESLQHLALLKHAATLPANVESCEHCVALVTFASFSVVMLLLAVSAPLEQAHEKGGPVCYLRLVQLRKISYGHLGHSDRHLRGTTQEAAI